MIKKCITCKREFETETKTRKYCCDRCKRIAEYDRRASKPTVKKKPEIKKTCPVCEKMFTATDSRKVYCSQKCVYIQNYRITFGNNGTCENCGKKLTGQRKRFCSDKCQRESFVNRTIAAHPDITKTCVMCGKEFKTGNKKRLYCSKECSRAAINMHARQRGYITKPETGEVVEKTIIPLGEAARMANEAGKTYGEMFAPKVEVIFPHKLSTHDMLNKYLEVFS